jgi:hypothetical protein
MADEHDYTRMWSGVFTPPAVGGDSDRGIYLLDDEGSVGRNSRVYDDCTRVLSDDAHPRSYPGGQRVPGPYGGGRASDRVGPLLAERQEAARRRAGARTGGEGFAPGPPAAGVTPEEQALYIEGSRRLGHPGPRGMVTSARGGRPAVDGVAWDNRPPHFAADAPNEYAHLYVAPEARGPPLFQRDPTFPGFRQVDHFAGGGGAPPASLLGGRGVGAGAALGLEIIKVVLLVVVVVLAVMGAMVSHAVTAAERRLRGEFGCALREAVAALRRP